MRRSTRSAALQWCAIALSVILIGMPTHRARAADPGEDAPAKPDAPKFDPTDAYDVSQVQGWTVRVNKKLGASDPALRDQVMELLHLHLYQVTRVVPKTAVEKLKTVVIWVELDDPKVKGMCYHPNADWLAKNGLNPEKVHGVEAGEREELHRVVARAALDGAARVGARLPRSMPRKRLRQHRRERRLRAREEGGPLRPRPAH